MKVILAVITAIAVVFAGLVFFFSRPKNLNITYKKADLDSIYKKVGVKFEPLVDGNSSGATLIVKGAHPVDETFTSAELTAAADNRSVNYAYFPFRNVQIRVNSDGSVEGSATVGYNDAVNYLVSLGVSHEDIVKAAAKFKIPAVNLPVYLKASGSIENNTSNISISSANIANIPVPRGLVDQYGPGINSLVDDVIKKRQPSYNIESLKVSDGKIHFKGTSPDVEMAAKSVNF